jgi:hypothetical protein
MMHSAFNNQIHRMQYMAVAPPAAGANATISFAANTRNRIITFGFHLLNDANVAGRKIYMPCSLDSYVLMFGADDTSLPANANVDCLGCPYSRDDLNLSTENRVPIWFNPDIIFGPSDTLTIQVVNIQAGDQLSNIYIVYAQWPA